MTRKISACTRGVAAVEMALIAPALFLLVLGILEFARYAYTYHEVLSYADALGRAVSVNFGSNLDVAELGSEYFLIGDYDNATVLMRTPVGTSIAYSQIEVQYHFTFLFEPLNNVFESITPIVVQKIYAVSNF